MSASAATQIPEDVRATAEEALEATTVASSVDRVGERQTRRWYGIGAIGVVLLGLGAFLSSSGLLLVAGLAVGYAMYYRVQTPPDVIVEVRRTLDDPRPAVGDEVHVTLTVENTGASTLYDLRIIDGVPITATVTDGAPRRATTLRPGQRTTLTYSFEAMRGYQSFQPTQLIVRDIAGTHEVAYEADAPSHIHVEPEEEPLPPMALRSLTAGMTGRIVTDSGGPGVEFFAVREYRPGDPLNRIDWNRRARSGELATVDFRREQMATVMLVIDLRPAAHVGRPDADRPASETCSDAAATLFFSLLDAGDRVGVTALGDRDCWLPPDIGTDHREHGRLLFTAHPGLGPSPPGGAVSVVTEEWELDHRIPDSTQLVFLTPLADGGAARYATRFENRGHPVTVISPDPCGRDTLGRTVATMERQLRIRRLRQRGIRVVDWDAGDESLAVVLEKAATRWSA